MEVLYMDEDDIESLAKFFEAQAKAAKTRRERREFMEMAAKWRTDPEYRAFTRERMKERLQPFRLPTEVTGNTRKEVAAFFARFSEPSKSRN